MAGAIDADSLKWYQCTTWTEGATHGGVIDTGNEITSGADENVFDDVSDAERAAGDTEYRKIFIRNENAATYEAVKLWISQLTLATNDEISICLGTAAGIQSTAGEGTDGTYVSPTSKAHGDVLTIGDLIQNASQAIWINRIVTAAGDGYTDNSFKLKVENS